MVEKKTVQGPPVPRPVHEIYAQRPPSKAGAAPAAAAPRAPTQAETQAAIDRVEQALVARLDDRVQLQLAPVVEKLDMLAELVDELTKTKKK